MGLKACLQAFLDHRREVLNRAVAMADRAGREAAAPAGRAADRLPEPRRGDPDRPLRRSSPRPSLIARFGLSEMQADYILDTRLRQLARIEEMAIENEYKALAEELANLQALSSSPAKQWKKIGQELAATRKAMVSPRRTTIAEAVDASAFVPAEAFIPKEADHGGPVRTRLDPGGEGQGRGSVGAEVQGGRQAWLPRARLHDRQAAGRGLGRAGVHASGPTSWRPGAGMASRCG